MAEYKGSIELISGITQKGGGDFPLASAKDIQVDDNGTRLDAKLTEVGKKLLPSVTSSDNGKVLSVVSGAWSATKPASSLPAVSSSDNGKVLSVVNGAWSASEPQGTQGGSAELPVYNLPAMGVPTIVVGASANYIEADTTAILNDLANGSIVMINNYDIGDGVPIPMRKIVNASVADGMALITSLDDMMGDMIVTMIMVQEGLILIKSYFYANHVKDLIDAYMEEALGGDY